MCVHTVCNGNGCGGSWCSSTQGGQAALRLLLRLLLFLLLSLAGKFNCKHRRLRTAGISILDLFEYI